MNKVTKYKQIVIEVLTQVGTLGEKPDDPIKTQIITDIPNGHFLLFTNGWIEDDRTYGCYLHVDVTDDGKVWLQYDGTDVVVGQKLMDKGIPKHDMVIGFHAPLVRQYTDFAVG